MALQNHENKSLGICTRLLTLLCKAFDWSLTHNTTHMKTALINLAQRVAAKDIIAIYTLAVIDVALVSAVIGLIALFV
jgi:hypothetical protein